MNHPPKTHRPGIATVLRQVFVLAVLAIAGSSWAADEATKDSIPQNLAPFKERKLWADSWLYVEAPKLEVETWLSAEPDTKGKYVLIEFWATYCPPCRRSIALLNEFHRKYKDELVVIGISHEPVETVKNFKEHTLEFYSAVDTQARMKKQLNVFGIPHVIILEPTQRCVIWEGFPLQPGFELKESTIQKILEVGRKLKAEKTQ